MDKKLLISRQTKSRAYQFIKSLMNDVGGDKIHNLIDAIRENVNEDVAGEILFDLLKNPDDPHANIVKKTSWIGPIHYTALSSILNGWAYFLDQEEIRGYAHLENEGWDLWNESLSSAEKLNKKELDNRKNKAAYYIVTFVFWVDAAAKQRADTKINRLLKWYQSLKL